jgi:spore germination cell wall hydrolase CwlJ-like protein
MNSHADYALLALCLWKEDRSGGNTGMTAVACVVRNRATRNHTTYYEELTEPEQFSSLTAKGDPELTVFPKPNDIWWQAAQLIAGNVVDGNVADITGGATMYYAPRGLGPTTKTFTPPGGQLVPFPEDWNATVLTYTVTIGGQLFFRPN